MQAKAQKVRISGPVDYRLVLPGLPPAPPKQVPIGPDMGLGVAPTRSKLDRALDRRLYNPLERFRRWCSALLPRRTVYSYADIVDAVGRVESTCSHIVRPRRGSWPAYISSMQSLCGENPHAAAAFKHTDAEEVQLCPMCVLAMLNGKR